MTEDQPQEATFLSDFDANNPYAGADIGRFPEWWGRNIEIFQEYGMRPYRPPRFADGVLTEAVVRSLEAKFGVDIRLRSTDPNLDTGWEIWIDDHRVSTIDRRRDGQGYTEYGIDSEAFRQVVSSFLRNHETGDVSK